MVVNQDRVEQVRMGNLELVELVPEVGQEPAANLDLVILVLVAKGGTVGLVPAGKLEQEAKTDQVAQDQAVVVLAEVLVLVLLPIHRI